jgi:hypothetical protein
LTDGRLARPVHRGTGIRSGDYTMIFRIFLSDTGMPAFADPKITDSSTILLKALKTVSG